MTEVSSQNKSALPAPGGRQLIRIAAWLFLAAGSAVASAAWSAEPLRCPPAGTGAHLQGDVPRFAARLDRSRTLKIVAIGSSSTAGAGASSPAGSYPSQLESDLALRFPAHDIDVINAGANGQEVPEMLARLDHDVLAYQPDLVIWQFGSNGLIRGRPIEEMELAARIGIDKLRRAGVEIMLMDLQHAPRIDGLAGRDDVLRMIERLSVSTGTALFKRYRLMKDWAVALGPAYAAMVDKDQLHMTDASYRCLAGALAAALQQAVATPVAARNGAALAARVRFLSPPTPATTTPSPQTAPSAQSAPSP